METQARRGVNVLNFMEFISEGSAWSDIKKRLKHIVIGGTKKKIETPVQPIHVVPPTRPARRRKIR